MRRMSYEGFEQHICANGHRYDTDATLQFDNEPPCLYCEAKSIFCNPADETNGGSCGIIRANDWERFLIEPIKTETCDKCNHMQVIAQARYRVPTKDEKEALRMWRDESGKYRYINSQKKLGWDSMNQRERLWAKYVFAKHVQGGGPDRGEWELIKHLTEYNPKCNVVYLPFTVPSIIKAGSTETIQLLKDIGRDAKV